MVKVIDSIMGSGKSTWAINYMKQLNDDISVLYVTPYLEEVDRIKKQCKPQKSFRTPKPVDGSKLKHILELLKNGEDIATTHELFKKLDNDCKEAIVNWRTLLNKDLEERKKSEY